MPAEYQLRNLDVAALIVFRDLMRFRDPNVVAELLNVRPSIIAVYLRRLRQVFDDQLFSHSNDLMHPTPYALELGVKIESALASMGALVEDSKAHDWVYGNRFYRIAADENFSALAYSNTIAGIREGGHNTKISWKISRQADAFSLLERNEVDLVLCQDPYLGEDHIETAIATSRYAVVSRKDHPEISKKLTTESYLLLNHVEVSPEGQFFGPVDATLKVLREKRKVSVSAPSVEAACRLVSETNIVATMPSFLARLYAKHYNLILTNVPFKQPQAKFSAVHHSHSERDQTIAWLIGRIKKSLVIR